MRKFGIWIIAASVAVVCSTAAWAVTDGSFTATDEQGKPINGATVTVTVVKKPDPSTPASQKQQQVVAKIPSHTDKTGKAELTYDEKKTSPDDIALIDLKQKDGKTWRVTKVLGALGGGVTVAFTLTGGPSSVATGGSSSVATGGTYQPVTTYGLDRGWVLGVGVNGGIGQSTNSYDDFPNFPGSGWGVGGFALARYYFSSGLFAGPEVGGMALGVNGNNTVGAFAHIRSMFYEGGQIGYSFRTPDIAPLNVYIGAAASQSNYRVGVDSRDFNESMDKTLNGFSVHAGVEVQPAPIALPNFWLGADYRYSHWRGTIGDDRVSWAVNFASVTASWQFPVGR
jgi:hypothetical protein